MGKRRTGLHPLAYMGVEPSSPPLCINKTFAPNSNYTGFNIGTIWINTETNAVYMLTNLDGGVATWSLLDPGVFPFSWNEVTDTTQDMEVNNGYISNNAALVTLTLPETAVVGKVIRVSGLGAGGWRIAQNALQKITFGPDTTTTGTGGYLEYTLATDAVELLCTVTNTTFNVLSSLGNITIV